MRRLGWDALALLLYAGLACVITWPLLPNLTTHVLGHERCTNLIHAWTIWAFGQEIAAGRVPVESPFIFHPVGANIVRLYGSDLLSPIVLSPLLRWASAGTLFNLKMLFSFTVGPFGVFLLCRWLGVSRPAAWVAGALFILSPFFLIETINGVSELVAVEWLPLAVLFLLRALSATRATDAAACALFSVLSLYSSAYSGLFLALMGGVAVVHHHLYGLEPLWGRARLRQLGVFAALAGVALIPFVALHATGGTASSLRAEQRTFTQATGGPTADAAADALRFLRPGRNTIPEIHERTGGGTDLIYTTYSTYVGWVMLALALVALLQRSERTRLWGWGALFFFVVALGPYLRIGGTPVSVGGQLIGLPTLLLYDVMPGFAVTARHTYRYATMLQLCLAVLAAFGVQRLLARRAPASRGLLTAGVVVVAMGEILGTGPAPWPLPLTRLEVPPFYQLLRSMPSPGAIIELPFTRNHLRDMQRYLYFQTIHGKPWIDGAMHFRAEARSLAFVQEVPLAQSFLAEDTIYRPLSAEAIRTSVSKLKDAGYAYVLVHDAWFDSEADLRETHEFLRLVFGKGVETPGELYVYAIDHFRHDEALEDIQRLGEEATPAPSPPVAAPARVIQGQESLPPVSAPPSAP